MYYVYILQSVSSGRYYVGSTADLHSRLAKHNAGHSVATKAYRPWKLVHFETYSEKSDAIKRELAIKRMKSRTYLASLIDGAR